MTRFPVSVGAVYDDSTVSVVSFDIAGILKQKSEHHCRHRPLRLLRGDLTCRKSLEALAIDCVGRLSGHEEATSIRIWFIALRVNITCDEGLFVTGFVA